MGIIYLHSGAKRRSENAWDFTWHLVGSNGAYKFYTDWHGYYIMYDSGNDRMRITGPERPEWRTDSVTTIKTTSPVDPGLTSLHIVHNECTGPLPCPGSRFNFARLADRLIGKLSIPGPFSIRYRVRSFSELGSDTG